MTNTLDVSLDRSSRVFNKREKKLLGFFQGFVRRPLWLEKIERDGEVREMRQKGSRSIDRLEIVVFSFFLWVRYSEVT